MPVPQRAADDVDRRIGELVAALVPDDATLQFGPGGIGEGIASSLHRPVRIRSGLLTDAMATLHARDLLLAPAVAAYTWGGDPIERLADAGMLGSKARVTVRFTSEQINLVRDGAGEVVEGDPRQIDTVIDLWTFERDTRSRDPNWQLVETGASS